MMVGSVISDGNVTWKVVNDQASSPANAGGGTLYSNAPVGSIISYSSNGDLPEGYLICNGAEVAVQDYPELYVKIGDTFGTASDEYHFVLPDLRDKFIEGSATAGDDIEAGLPNIKGSINTGDRAWTFWSAAAGITTGSIIASNVGESANATGQGTKAYLNGFSFDASLSNPIYSDDVDTVQPASITMIYLIKAYEATEEFIQEELNQDNFAIIYPNGGSEESPANVSNNSTYILNNPFPGFDVQCKVEIYYENQWGTMPYCGFVSGGSDLGMNAFCAQHNDGNLHLSIGNYGFGVVGTVGSSNIEHHYATHMSTWIEVNTPARPMTLPCRIKVWKINSIDKTPTIRTQNVVAIGHSYDEGEAWCYVYPNNGTAESPANVSNNSRYILENPFPGYIVSVQAEIYISNQWGCAPYVAFRESNGDYNGNGIYCFQHNDGKIVLTTGKTRLCYTAYQNDVYPSTFTSPTNSTSAPCRVKVFKMGKL